MNVHVCDNGSEDDTDLVLSDKCFSEVHKFYAERPGKSLCLNMMINSSNGDYLLFTDDDVVVPNDWIHRMLSYAIESHSEAVVGGIAVADEVIPIRWNLQHLAYFASTRHVSLDHDHPFIGANYLVSRSAYNRVGGFNPLVGPGGIGHAEDTLFWLQCRTINVKIMQAREVEVLHYPAANRLNDTGIISLAKKQGEFEAYVDYHWEHYNRPYLWLSCLARLVKLVLGWIQYTSTKSNPESILDYALVIRKFYSVCRYIRFRRDKPHYCSPQGTQFDFRHVGQPRV